MNKGINTAKYLCLLPGFFLIISGLLILLAPDAAGKVFDITDSDKLKEPFALAMGIRQVAIGLMIVALALSNQIKALAIIMLIGAIVPATDFFFFRPTIGAFSALRHVAPVPLIAGLGIYLLLKIKNR
ncbi:uncharacterized protein YjeT (DUF2065 family) [Pedobacter sp. UYP30]|uniref:DUF4267 domain-containing protein n=1 Tax=Pedobacter sp. UYP30 TaxID=1756400 RepID=UPI0033953ABC